MTSAPDPAALRPLSNRLLLLPACVILATSIWSAARGIGELAQWSPAQLGTALSATEAERLENHVEQTKPGAYELVCELRRLLPDDSVVFGFYPSEAQATEDPALYKQYTEALTLLGELQLLLYPTNVQIMPALTNGLTLPPNAPIERIFAIDLGFPDTGILQAQLEPIVTLKAGTLYGVRGVEHQLLEAAK